MAVLKTFAIFFTILSLVYSKEVKNDISNKVLEEFGDSARSLVEQGRTFVHHAVKRMAFIMPAIFFKMGIAFALLMLITVVSVNNGFIGFLLLVVGMSTVLARLQEARTVPVPINIPGQFVDRSDTDYSSQLPQPTTSYSQNSPYYAGTDIIFKKYTS